MHCHRGFCELPYFKEISGGNSDQYGYFNAKDHTGATCKVMSGVEQKQLSVMFQERKDLHQKGRGF